MNASKLASLTLLLTLSACRTDKPSGTTDAGTTDGGTTDAGTTDAGTTDAGTTDAGTTVPTDEDGDGYSAEEDCDDGDATVHPDAEEICDELDNNCNGEVNEGLIQTWYADADADGFGDDGASTDACAAPSGYVDLGGDCDDGSVDVNPDATEICDGIDDNCNGVVDEDSAADAATWYADADGDGYGDADSSAVACDAPAGFGVDATDCDDSSDAAYPGGEELCDGLDNNCDGSVDEDTATDAGTWFIDADGDGYGDPASTVSACSMPADATTDDTDCDDDDPDINPGQAEICSGVDDNCDGVVDDLGPVAIYGGTLTVGAEQHYQYSPVTAGDGYLSANWAADTAADSYELAVGTTSGGTDVSDWTDVGSDDSTTLSGLSLSGAWDGTEYFISVRTSSGGTACALSATSQAVQIAEAQTWTGDIADLRATDSYGGSTADWPETGVDAVYGEHWFETVDIASATTVRVQGFGAEDAVAEDVAATDAAVTDPADGWLSLYANDIVIAGTVTASGRGYGGGAGGGAGVYGGYQGYGGSLGLGGDGGPADTTYPGAGGGGSPGGAGGVGATTGGAGNLYGGGSGSTGCSGADGNDGGDGATGTIGTTGTTASSSAPGSGGEGEFTAGGGDGVSGCDNWTGGGGGGYGAGGSGGTQWASSTLETSGGGGGGTGGSGGLLTVDGGAAAGPHGGTGGVGGGSTGSSGTIGGYLASASNGDSSTDRSLALGCGGGGGSGGYQESGGGGGGAGGGAISLYAFDTMVIQSTATVVANGAGGGGGGRDDGGLSTSAAGSSGAGGGLLFEAQDLTIDAVMPYLSARGGDGSTTNGGTIKLFYDKLTGTSPDSTAAGRVYDPGAGSWSAP